MNAFSIPRPTRTRRGPDLTPVMDVVFILVVFFLVVSTFSETLVKPMQVTLPGSSNALPAQSPAQLRLAADTVLLNGEAVSPTDLVARLTATAGTPLVIVTAEGASYQALVDALDAAQLAGIASVSVQRDPEVDQ